MYSPKIDEELIPRLYRIARAREVPMTALVNRILRRSIAHLEKCEAMKKQLKLRFEEKEREVVVLKIK
jgi:peptide subunit release factor RF-3